MCVQVPRALESGEVFLDALGWQDAPIASAPADSDPLLRFHKLCRDYLLYKDSADEALVRRPVFSAADCKASGFKPAHGSAGCYWLCWPSRATQLPATVPCG